jgi:hypothetical protein
MLMVIQANAALPAVTAQDVGRDLYHHRQKIVQIIGDPGALKKIAWIFQRVPDMFDIRFLNASLVVRCACYSRRIKGERAIECIHRPNFFSRTSPPNDHPGNLCPPSHRPQYIAQKFSLTLRQSAAWR